jgi:hypothetical protein
LVDRAHRYGQGQPLLPDKSLLFKMEPDVMKKRRYRRKLRACERRMGSDILEQYYNEDGILCVDLLVDGIRKQFLVHELVCRTFHGPAPTEDSVATLIDPSKPPQADNVCWTTPAALRK